MQTATKLETKTEAAKLDLFLADLTELSRKHGIGLGGRPEPYVMEPEDMWYLYVCDQDGLLALD